jgi:citrate lyase subunit beta/citryl-CoA lyase
MQEICTDAEKPAVIRSFLFVPGDSERKLEKASGVGADALIIDLEDSVTADARPAARELARHYIEGRDECVVRSSGRNAIGAGWHRSAEAQEC